MLIHTKDKEKVEKEKKISIFFFFYKMENIEKVILDKNTTAYTKRQMKEQGKHGKRQVTWSSWSMRTSQRVSTIGYRACCVLCFSWEG